MIKSMSVEVYGIRETLAEIRDVDKDLFFEIRAFMKRAGDTLGRRIQGNIPLIAPIRGFRHSGRTAWRGASTKTVVSGRNARAGMDGATPLLQVIVNGTAVSIADMAGRGGGKTRLQRTRTYEWKGTSRRHNVTTQGQAMIRALGMAPSRYIYPEAEASVPFIQGYVLQGVEQYMNKLNRNLEVIGDR
jgi:hypothetical protein